MMIRVLATLLLLPVLAFAQDMPETVEAIAAPADPYTVTDVIVDVSGDDAVKARNEAFEKGPQLALVKFLAQNGSDIDPAGVDADRLINDFQVMEERFSRTRYVANLTYHFKPGPASRVLDPTLPPEPVVDPMAPAMPEPGLIAPVDPDAPWVPAPATQPLPPSVMPGPAQTGPQSWRLTVRYGQVTQWLLAQDLLTARPEIRGVKLNTMAADRADLLITTDEPVAETKARWQSMGWNVSDDGQGGLVLDAGTLGAPQ